jgi:hypothetical protein
MAGWQAGLRAERQKGRQTDRQKKGMLLLFSSQKKYFFKIKYARWMDTIMELEHGV